MLTPETIQQINQLAGELAEMFTPPELTVGCEVMSVADASEYDTNNGWIEAVVGRHNQQRCRWRGQFTVQVGDYVDVLYFASYKLFTVFGQGGDGAITPPGGGAWPAPGAVNLWDVSADTVTAYASIQDAIDDADTDDVVVVGSDKDWNEQLSINKKIHLVGVGRPKVSYNSGATVTFAAPASGATWSGIDIETTAASGDAYAVTIADTVRLYDCFITGLAEDTVNYAARVTGGVPEFHNCVMDASGGIAAANYSLYVTDGDSCRVVGGKLIPAIGTNVYVGAGANVYFEELPTFDGTVAGTGDLDGATQTDAGAVKIYGTLALDIGAAVNTIADSVAGMTDSDDEIATSAAIIDYGDANWSGGGVWPLAGHITKTDDGSDYTTVAGLIAALTGDEQVIFGQGEFTSDNESVPVDSSYLGSGANDLGTVISSSTAAKTITIDGDDAANTHWQNIKFYNSDGGNDTMAVYCVDGGTHEFVNCQFITVNGGGWNAYAFAFETGNFTLTFRDCTFSCTGGATNRGIYILSGIGTSTINFIDCQIVGATAGIAIGDSDATINIDGGSITGALSVTGSTVNLINNPKITDTVTGVPVGWYTNTAGKLIRIGAGTELDIDGLADGIILDADADTTISSPTDDQIDFEVGGTDRMTLTASGLALQSGVRVDDIDTVAVDDDTALATSGAVYDRAVGLSGFSVHKNGSAQNISSSTYTKVTWSTENYDINGDFASDKHTPTIAGKYLYIGCGRLQAMSDQNNVEILLYKNGASVKGGLVYTSGNNAPRAQIVAILEMNGSTDYVEMYMATNASATTIRGAETDTYFQGMLVAR